MADLQPLAAAVLDACVARGLTLATAESLTGGLLGATLVSVPGASRVYRGGVVAYDTALKASLLGVSHELLVREGPVHGDVATQMAEGVRVACAVAGAPATVGLATTGVAGPDPDPQTGQPAGTVWIALSLGGRSHTRLLQLSGDRAQVREATIEAILRLTLLKLSEEGSDSAFSRE